MTIRVALPRIGPHNSGEGFAQHICKGGNMFDILGSAQRFCDGLSRPSFGSVVSRLRGNANADIPPFVSLRGMAIGCEPGYLGVAHRAFTPDGPGLANLNLAGGVTTERTGDRRTLLDSFDAARRDVDA